MRKIVFTVMLACCSFFSQAQLDKWKFGIKLAPTVNIASVKDNDPTPSAIRYQADGYTIKESNQGGFFFGFTTEYLFSEHFSFHSGLWFTQKNYEIRNYDGGYPNNPSFYGVWYMNNYYYNYSGTSVYQTSYMQIPIVFKYTSKELFSKFRLYATFGPTIDIKTGEKLKDSDYAHYWNMSRNLYTSPNGDPTRGRNSAGKKVALFNPIDITLYMSLGATYEIIDNLDLYGGLMLNKGFLNQVNPRLRFAEPNQTKVNSDISWKSFLIGFEMGAAYRFTK